MIIKPNWVESFKVTYDFSTEIITSRSGREQRIAQRITPRKTFDYKSLVHGAQHRRLHQLLRAQQHEPMVMPEFTRKVKSAVPASSGAVSITVPSAPWLVLGATIFIEDDMHTIASVLTVGGNRQVGLNEPLLQSRAAGFRVYYGVTGYLQPSQAVSQATSNTAELNLKFSVLPGSELIAPPAAETMFNGREVLTKKPNWAGPPSFTYSRAVEELDYGRGLVERFNPVPFGTTMVALQFLARDVAEADDIVNMQARLLGRQGEFYMSTGLNDITPMAVAASGTYTLQVAGPQFATDFADDTVHRAVAVRLFDGTVIRNKLLSVAAVGQNTTLTFESPWPVTLGTNVLMISWLPVWRMASDSLTIEWVTDTVAQYKINVQTLEDLPV